MRHLSDILFLLLLTSPILAQSTVIDTTYHSQGIYPGTTRRVQVSLPHGYQAGERHAMLVCLDGIVYYRAVQVMDSLATTGDMPKTIGLFIDPGVVRQDDEIVRYNRSNEFDRTDGRFARFLEAEIYPFIESLHTPDGQPIILPHDATDCAITGASSGGICAFVAAWERPDLFSRVYSAVGTFVSMRGGHELPALVRKYETKPIRFFLQDGEKDAWNPLFGTWWEYNQLMASALTFAGYEADWRWDKGGHSIYYGTQVFPEAMKYLWKDWPKPVSTRKSENDMLQAIEPEREWHKRSTTERTPRPCRSAIYPGGAYQVVPVTHSNQLQTAIRSAHKADYVQDFYWLHRRPTDTNNPCLDMCFDENGNLFVLTELGIQVCDQNGRVRAILNLPYPGTPQAMQLTPDGTLHVWMTDGTHWSKKTQVKGATKDSARPKSQGQG